MSAYCTRTAVPCGCFDCSLGLRTAAFEKLTIRWADRTIGRTDSWSDWLRCLLRWYGRCHYSSCGCVEPEAPPRNTIGHQSEKSNGCTIQSHTQPAIFVETASIEAFITFKCHYMCVYVLRPEIIARIYSECFGLGVSSGTAGLRFLPTDVLRRHPLPWGAVYVAGETGAVPYERVGDDSTATVNQLEMSRVKSQATVGGSINHLDPTIVWNEGAPQLRKNYTIYYIFNTNRL